MMKHILYFYREPGANFIVVHTFLKNGSILCHAVSEGEHDLDLNIREGHDENQIQNELKEILKAADITAWDEFDEEDEFELTHVETCMGPVTKDYSFSFEWED